MTLTPARAQARINNLFRELDLIGCYTDDHATEYDGQAFITPSIIDNDDGKEDNITHGNHENPVA